MKRNTKRLPALLLAILLCLSLLPATALAAYPSRFYASINFSASSSNSDSFGTFTSRLNYVEITGTTTNRVIYGMESAGDVFFTVEGSRGKAIYQDGAYILVDDGWRELRMYNSTLKNYRVIGQISPVNGNYMIVDTAIDLSGTAPVLYGTYQSGGFVEGNYVPDCPFICEIDLKSGKPSNQLQVTGLESEENDIIYAIAFDQNGTLYAIGADKGAVGGEATLYTIDLEHVEDGMIPGLKTVPAHKVGAITSQTGNAISTNFAQDMAFDYANDTLYWAENDENVLYTVDTNDAVASWVGQVKYSNKPYALQSFCVPNDTRFAEDKHMISVIYTGAGTVTDETGTDKPFYMVNDGEDFTLTIHAGAADDLLGMQVDGRTVDLTPEYTFENVTEDHVIELTLKKAIPAEQNTIWWFHYQGKPASFYTKDNIYKFYDLPYLDKEAPRDGYVQTLLDEDGDPIDDDEIILPGKYDVCVTHPGNEDYAAMDVVYPGALDLQKCNGTPGRPVVYGKVGCKQGDLATTSYLQGYYGSDGKFIDPTYDEIPVTLVWLEPETTYNEAGNFYASATIYAGKLSDRILACYNDNDGKPLTDGCLISSRATQVVVLPENEASIIKVQASNASGGTVSGKGVYKNSTEVTVTATVNTNAGFTFGGWEENGKVVSNALSYTFIAEHDRTLTALFEIDPEYRVILKTDPADAGTVTGGGNYKEVTDHKATVTATPNPGYYFIGWYKGDNFESANASYEVTVPEDGITLTAKFGIDLLGRAEQAKENLKSALGTSAFEWRTLTEAMDAYEKAEEFVENPPSGVENARARFEALTGYYSGVTELNFSNLGLGNEDLKELHLFTGVTELNLSGNRGVTDLTDLADIMTQLETLDLSNLGITDLSSLQGLSGFTTLETLNLSGNSGITSLSVLESLGTLETLDLSNTDITDLGGLSGLTTLETLNLSGNAALSDLSGLQGLDTLRTLDISDTGVDTLESLIAEGECIFPGYIALTAQNLTLTSLSALEGVIEADGFNVNSIGKWDFSDSILTVSEENQAAVDLIGAVLGDKFIAPAVQDEPTTPPEEPEPVIPVEPVNPGGSSSGDDDGYSVSVPASSSVRGGSITVSPRSADKGDTVTITVKPNDGYELDELTVATRSGSELALTSKGNGRYTFTMPASDVKIQVSFRKIAAAAVNPFTDIAANAYYYDAVLWAVENGITNGTTATTFSPDATVTRAQMVTFLWRAHGAPRADGANPFTDVSSNAYYYDAVLWAVANGITNGTTATTFSPDAPVTRAQAVTFQWRTAGSPAVSGGSFGDVAADAYYAGAVTWAVANGVTNGTTATTFSPDAPVTRSQAVTFLWRELA